jgi:hypothetical protein
MAGRAVDIESLLAALENRLGDWKWKLGNGFVAIFPGVEARVFVQMASRDSAGNNWPGSSAVVEEAAASQRFVSRLIVHVLTAADGEEEQDSPKHNCGAGW